MTILVAPDTFKHSLSAIKAAEIMKKAVLAVDPKIYVVIHPLADGGEGTVDAILRSIGGKIVDVMVHDPLMRTVRTSYGYIPEKKMAIIEMASASGIEWLHEKERNPLKTSSYGTGELIRAALDLKCREIIVGIGGSATVDGGMGAIQALGGRFMDADGNELSSEGKSLSRLANIDLTLLDSRLEKVSIRIACDVDNPLTGPQGAAKVYGPQKGATPEMVEILEKNLDHFANIIARDTGTDIREIPCSGAAGGMGGGFMSLLDARLAPGFEIIRKLTRLDDHIKSSDIILTGEGKMDDQDFFGKAPFALAQLARKMKKKIIAFPGAFVTENPERWHAFFTGIFPITASPQSLEEALKLAEQNLFRTVKEVIRIYTFFQK